MDLPKLLADRLPITGELRRELYFFTLYRLFEAALLCLTVFGRIEEVFGHPRFPMLAAAAALTYLLASIALFVIGQRHAMPVPVQVGLGIAVDIVVSAVAVHAMPSVASGIAVMLLFNIGATALLVPLRYGLLAASAAGTALLAQHVWNLLSHSGGTRPAAEIAMFTVSYLAIATLTSLLGRQLRASEALAEQRGSQAASLAEINELIIRRMRTGVLLVGREGDIRLANEAAMMQLGSAGEGRRLLATAAPELALRLRRWEREGSLDADPIQLGAGLPEVLPRFARLLADDDQVLVFLDNAELTARRAESLTLATLGRFSASLAHEIRNPLAAISYATQLLEESSDIVEADRRLLGIIYQQTRRMNGIVENVLGLARRERAQPENVELAEFTREFVADYVASHPLNDDTLDTNIRAVQIPCMVDRRQLQQVVTVLVHNALVYGRMPGEPARVELRIHADSAGNPLLDVLDHGPGIPEGVAGKLFRPFFTTSSHGTGLGLYIAREMCSANQADLRYVPLPGGGACFRIQLTPPHAISTT